MIYISKGRIEALNKCRRRYYYSYHYRGGWDARSPSINLAIGIAVHKGLELAIVGKGDEGGNAAVKAFDDYTKDWPTDDLLLVQQHTEGRDLAFGLVLAWSRVCYDDFDKRFQLLSIEKEIELPLTSDIILVARCDATVRDKQSGLAYVWNWKTTGEKKDWNSKWLYDIQMWSEAQALEYSLGEAIGGTIVCGLYKGTKDEGRLASKLIYRYEKDGQARPDYAKGWTRTRVTDVAEWVATMPIETLREMFLESQPILRNEEVVEQWIKQIVRLENDVQHIATSDSEQDRLDYFTQSFSTLNCRWCPFLDACMQRGTIDGLITAGRLVQRRSPLTDRNS